MITDSTVSGSKKCAASSEGVVKDETVFVLAECDVKARKIIVSDWLKNTRELDRISDSFTISGIENVKGDEGFTL